MVRAISFRALRFSWIFFLSGSNLSRYRLGSKLATSPPMRQGRGETSQDARARTPVRPAHKASQEDPASPPRGVTRPKPLKTTRREEAAMAHLLRRPSASGGRAD